MSTPLLRLEGFGTEHLEVDGGGTMQLLFGLHFLPSSLLQGFGLQILSRVLDIGRWHDLGSRLSECDMELVEVLRRQKLPCCPRRVGC